MWIFPNYFRAFPEQTQKRIIERSQRLGTATSGEALFLHAYPVVTENASIQARLDDFRNQYGFGRNMLGTSTPKTTSMTRFCVPKEGPAGSGRGSLHARLCAEGRGRRRASRFPPTVGFAALLPCPQSFSILNISCSLCVSSTRITTTHHIILAAPPIEANILRLR